MSAESRRRRSAIALWATWSMVMCFSIPAYACTVEVAPLAFGSINPLDASDSDSVTTLSVVCPSDTPYTATVNAGTGSFTTRHMTGAQGSLDYQLYTEASRSLIWGDGSAGTNSIAGTAGTTGDTHNLYGRVPAQAQAVPGSYSDTLLVTITY